MSGHGDEGPIAEWVGWFFKLIFSISEQTKYAGDWGVSRALYAVSVYIGLLLILGHLVPNIFLFTFQWMIALMPFWLPVGLMVTGWFSWIWYVQALYISGRNPVLLEMKVPREIYQSPRAMEVALASLWISSSETTFLHRAWKGQVRPFFSLEMASFGGDVRFYIWAFKNYQHAVEETMYSMYPSIELHVVEDYASRFRYDDNKHTIFATEWRLESAREKGRKPYGKGKFRVTDFYPIKSYVDFELDKDPKEEYRVDPLANIIEFLSSVHAGEQIWVQLIIRKAGRYAILLDLARDDEWKHGVMDEVEFIRAQSNAKPGHELSWDDFVKMRDAHSDDPSPRFPNPAPRQRAMMEALDRHMAKLPFEFLGRGLYITEHSINGPTFTHMRWMWKSVGNSAYGSHLRPRRWHCDFDYPWQDVMDIRSKLQGRRALDAFRRRSAYYSPWKLPTEILTTESLATLWRPVSSAIKSPGLERIPAKKAEAPLNLPR